MPDNQISTPQCSEFAPFRCLRILHLVQTSGWIATTYRVLLPQRNRGGLPRHCFRLTWVCWSPCSNTFPFSGQRHAGCPLGCRSRHHRCPVDCSPLGASGVPLQMWGLQVTSGASASRYARRLQYWDFVYFLPVVLVTSGPIIAIRVLRDRWIVGREEQFSSGSSASPGAF